MKNFKNDTMKVGEAWITTWDLSTQTAATSATISASVWSVCSGTGITISADSISGSKVQALLTATAIGVTTVDATVTYSNGEIGVYEVQVTVQKLC
jgi:galactitol-specific phosphotransferase system IIB component